MSEYIVKLNKDGDDNFEIDGRNVAKLRVYDDQGDEITKSCRVLLELSEDGMLGLGTELIRLAKKFEDGKHIHIRPVSNNLISQAMGIYLTPSSCELIICCNDLGVIEAHLDSEN